MTCNKLHGKHGEYCERLKVCDHYAWAGIGYLLFFLGTIGSIAALGASYLQATEVDYLTDICILNMEETECSLGLGCVWNASSWPLCVNPDCDPQRSISVAAEYAQLIMSFANFMIMLPAIRDIVAGVPYGSAVRAALDTDAKYKSVSGTKVEMLEIRRNSTTAKKVPDNYRLDVLSNPLGDNYKLDVLSNPLGEESSKISLNSPESSITVMSSSTTSSTEHEEAEDKKQNHLRQDQK